MEKRDRNHAEGQVFETKIPRKLDIMVQRGRGCLRKDCGDGNLEEEKRARKKEEAKKWGVDRL